MIPIIVILVFMVFMLALGLLPRLVLARWKGQARAFDLGYEGEGIPIDVGGGYSRMSLGGDQVRAHMIKASLQARGVLCRLDQINGGSGGAIASTHILHFQTEDLDAVIDEWTTAIRP